MQMIYIWIKPPVDAYKKWFANKPKGLQQISGHVRKVLGKENPDLVSLLCVIYILTFLKELSKQRPIKIDPSELDSPFQKL